MYLAKLGHDGTCDVAWKVLKKSLLNKPVARRARSIVSQRRFNSALQCICDDCHLPAECTLSHSTARHMCVCVRASAVRARPSPVTSVGWGLDERCTGQCPVP